MYRVKLTTHENPSKVKNATFDNEKEFETAYFFCLRKKTFKLVHGFIDDKLEFVIENGIEVCEHRAKILSLDPNNWIAPTSAQFYGVVSQFKKKKKFCDAAGVTRAGVANWLKGRAIDFYRWSFVLSYLDIKRTFSEGREECLDVNIDI